MKNVSLSFDKRIKVTVLWSLTNLRLDDAWALFYTDRHERRNGAIYLAGYSVECALKAKISEKNGKTMFDPDAEPELKIHGLKLLAERGGLLKTIEKNEIMARWLVILDTNWSVALRYQQRSIKPEEVLKFLRYAKGFTQWLHGQ